MSVSSNPIRFGLNPRGMSFERTVEIARACRFSLDELAYEYPDDEAPAGWGGN